MLSREICLLSCRLNGFCQRSSPQNSLLSFLLCTWGARWPWHHCWREVSLNRRYPHAFCPCPPSQGSDPFPARSSRSLQELEQMQTPLTSSCNSQERLSTGTQLFHGGKLVMPALKEKAWTPSSEQPQEETEETGTSEGIISESSADGSRRGLKADECIHTQRKELYHLFWTF